MAGNHSSGMRQRTIYDHKALIESIAVQEYYRIADPAIPFSQVVRLAALAVRVAMQTGPVNINMLACLIRKTVRLELAAHY